MFISSTTARSTGSKVFGLISLVLSIVIGVYAFDFGRGLAIREKIDKELNRAQQATIASLRAETEQLRAQLKQAQAAAVNGGVDATRGSRYDSAEADRKQFDARLSAIEKAILASPAKALEMILLQRDIESLKAV